MPMPNFLVIGAAKAGTSSLYHYLKQHPQIYMSSQKELRFFSLVGETIEFCGPGDQQLYKQKSVTDQETYLTFFSDVTNEKAIGEASPGYLYYPKAPENIKHYLPNVKLIAILRDPVERAYSHFIHNLKNAKEPLSDFTAAVEAEESRTQKHWGPNWHYQKTGLYYAQVKRYFDTFDRRQIKIYLYDEFKSTPIRVVQDIFRFLEVDEFVPNVSFKYNVSKVAKNKQLHTFVTRPPSVLKPFMSSFLGRRAVGLVKKYNVKDKPSLNPETRRKMVQEYREDILKLQDLINCDLSGWLSSRDRPAD